MKRSILVWWMILSSISVFADQSTCNSEVVTRKSAQNCFHLRGENQGRADSNAFKAAQIYEVLAEGAADKVEQAEYLVAQSEALFFYGVKRESTQEKINTHKKGYEAAWKAKVNLEGEGLVDEQATLLARALYFWGANFGKWGEPQSAAVKAQNWPKLKNQMERIISMGQAAVENYGANRILGRAFFKLPWPLGGDKKSYEKLIVAFNKTLDPATGISTHSTNNLYLAETLISIDEDEELEQARMILTKMLEVGTSMDPNRVPETAEDLVLAQELLDDLD